MGDLKAFLKEQSDKRLTRQADVESVRREWIAAIESLIDRMIEWLREADSSHLLKIEKRLDSFCEEKLDVYDAPSLSFALGGRVVVIKPVARFVVGPRSTSGGLHVIRSEGLVSMGNGEIKYRLYRIKDDRGERWQMVDDHAYRAVDFDRSAFEDAVQRMLE